MLTLLDDDTKPPFPHTVVITMKYSMILPLLVITCAAGCTETAESARTETLTRPGPSGGKGDVTVSKAQCLAHFAQDDPCPSYDRYTSSLEESAAELECLERKAAQPEAECCLQDELKNEPYCVTQFAENMLVVCQGYQDLYQSCALSTTSDAVTCRQSYVEFMANPLFDCCNRLDTMLCDDNVEVARLETIEDIVTPIIEAGGHVQLSSLSPQISHVDVMPSTLQNSISFLMHDEVSDALNHDSFATYTLATQLPVQYSINSFFPNLTPNAPKDAPGRKLRDVYGGVDAYLSYWRTQDDRIVLATHYMDFSGLQAPGYGWVTGPTFVLPESICDLIDHASPSSRALIGALDEVSGHVAQSCVKQVFSPLDVDTELVQKLAAPLFYAMFLSTSADSRLNHVSEAYAISTTQFTGYMIYLDEQPTQADLDFNEEHGIDLPLAMQKRVLLNAAGEVIGHYDDDACEYSGDALDTICGKREALNL